MYLGDSRSVSIPFATAAPLQSLLPYVNSWCRCMILSSPSSNKLQLLSVDYGRLFECNADDVSDLPPDIDELTALPFQAIECHMATVLPADSSEWPDAAGDLVWKLCSKSDNLFARVSQTVKHFMSISLPLQRII